MRLRINLLPPDRKQAVAEHRWLVFVMKQGVNLCLLSVLVFGLVWGIGWLIHKNLVTLQILENNSLKQDVAQELSGYQDEIKRANLASQQFSEREKQHPHWSRLFSRLESITPDGVTLDALLNSDYKVSVSGQASSRDVLIDFRDRLTRDDCFRDVQLPLSNLFSQEKVDFQMDMTFRQECLKDASL